MRQAPKEFFPFVYLKTPGIGVYFRYSWSKVLKGCHDGLCLQLPFVQFSLSDDSLHMKIPGNCRHTHLKAYSVNRRKILTLPVSTLVFSPSISDWVCLGYVTFPGPIATSEDLRSLRGGD